MTLISASACCLLSDASELVTAEDKIALLKKETHTPGESSVKTLPRKKNGITRTLRF